MRHSFLDPGTVLFGKTRRRVLGLLFGHPDESFYVRDIVRRSGAAQGAIARELDALLGAGLLWRREDGRNVYYQANKQAPVFAEIERLVAKTISLGETIREALAPLAARIEYAVVLGSTRTPSKSPRPADLLVIGDVRPAQVADALAAMKKTVDPEVYSLAELRKKIADDPGFFNGLFAMQPVFVIGEPEDFRRLGAARWSKRRA
jgi:DNA-binding transcriptional ArsR family regulator